MNNANDQLVKTAEALVEKLRRQNQRIVFAESCTGGLVAATLTQIPGVSSWLCGSAVTYQEQTKQAWLDVSPQDLQRFTAVSEQVTEAMATQVLAKTPQAAIAFAVTGHLGPDAPPDIDGVVFITGRSRDRADSEFEMRRIRLTQSDRRTRQIEAAEAVLRFALENC